MKIYPYLSYHREIIGTDVNYICNLQKVWDSSDSLNGIYSSSLLFFIRYTISMMEKAPVNDFRTVPSAEMYCCK